MGVKAATELQSKKCDDVEILVSDKVSTDKDLLGIFANSFNLSNYEYTFKTQSSD